jgi:short subunit dehydrogenase-like uncharacterized protein
MLNACLATQTNYIDITGEIEVFEAMWSREAEIKRAGITAVPGAGFDVVPTNCLAGYVASKVERPAWLVIVLRGLQSASQGTLRTAIRQVSKPVLCRRAGAIVALDDRSPRWVDFGSGDEPCVPVSWGDVATAFHSTGVGNITVYYRRTQLFRSANILGKLFGPLLRSRIGQEGLAAIVRRFPEGPNQAERSGHQSTIWAEAIDSAGKSFKAILTTPDAYDFSANSALDNQYFSLVQSGVLCDGIARARALSVFVPGRTKDGDISCSSVASRIRLPPSDPRLRSTEHPLGHG